VRVVRAYGGRVLEVLTAGDVVAQVRCWLGAARRVAVFTGAGVSTASGIPDFRGPDGLWTKDPAAQRLFSLPDYLTDPELRRTVWQRRAAHPARCAEPNPAHDAIVTLERTTRLVALVTQNVDGLHQRAGSDASLVLELHGSQWQVLCLGCRERGPMEPVLARVRAGDLDPACEECGGILKSGTVAFGEVLPQEVFRAARAAVASCELLLAVGSSLTVQPAASLCRVATRAGARLVVINAEPTSYDAVALASGGAVLRGRVEQVLPELVAGLARATTARS